MAHLKDELHPKLQLPRAAQIAARRAGGQDLSEIRRREAVRRLSEVGVIE